MERRFRLAFLASTVLYPQDWVGGGLGGLTVPRPVAGPIDFSNDRAFFVLATVILTIVSFATVFLRRGTIGRSLAALRGSEVAGVATGINPVRAKITVFALSAFVAGLGGGLLASFQTFASTGDEGGSPFSPFFGIVWVVVVVTLGARSVQAAITGGISFVIFPVILEEIGAPPELFLIFFGLGALTFARHPEGIIEAQTRWFMGRLLPSALKAPEHTSVETEQPAAIGAGSVEADPDADPDPDPSEARP